MVELELLGANGDTIVMTDEDGERYSSRRRRRPQGRGAP